MEKRIILDTSFLITLLDEQRNNHNIAKQYFEYFITNKFLLFVSAISISEYCIKGNIDELPLDYITTLPFNLEDAVLSKDINFLNANRTSADRDSIKDDFKIIGQAENRHCDFIITDDKNSLYKFVKELRNSNKIQKLDAIILDSFTPTLLNPQTEMNFVESEEDNI